LGAIGIGSSGDIEEYAISYIPDDENSDSVAVNNILYM
jgi:hypothetical protein